MSQGPAVYTYRFRNPKRERSTAFSFALCSYFALFRNLDKMLCGVIENWHDNRFNEQNIFYSPVLVGLEVYFTFTNTYFEDCLKSNTHLNEKSSKKSFLKKTEAIASLNIKLLRSPQDSKKVIGTELLIYYCRKRKFIQSGTFS